MAAAAAAAGRCGKAKAGGNKAEQMARAGQSQETKGARAGGTIFMCTRAGTKPWTLQKMFVKSITLLETALGEAHGGLSRLE